MMWTDENRPFAFALVFIYFSKIRLNLKQISNLSLFQLWSCLNVSENF